MPSARITKRAVDAVVPINKDFFLWDDSLKGFGLRVTSSGIKSYVFQYRMGGREAPTRRYTIGKHGSPWTTEGARREATRLLTLVRQRLDPVDADRARRREAEELAFEQYVGLFTDKYLRQRWKQWQLGAGVLQREAVPVLRNKPLTKIRRSDLTPIWDRLEDRPAVARLTHATLRKLFRWAINRGDLERSPMEGMQAPPAVAARDRILSDEELACLWMALAGEEYPWEHVFKMLILTGQRRGEVALMDWREVHRADAEWILPGSRTKNGKPQHVSLSPPAIEILDCLAIGPAWPASGLIFSMTKMTPVSGFSKAKRRIDDLMKIQLGGRLEHWRIHDLRRTFATGLQRLGIRFEVTEAVLNHVSGSKSGVAGVYQRYDWASEKKAALEAWAVHVLAEVKMRAEESNVEAD